MPGTVLSISFNPKTAPYLESSVITLFYSISPTHRRIEGSLFPGFLSKHRNGLHISLSIASLSI